MKRLWMTVAALAMAAMVAAAQTPDDATMKKLKAEMDQLVAQSKVVGLSGSMMNSTVKGAPYAAVEVTETNQVLADGTRIHNENQTKVYRDGEGRMRRETPDQVTIMDPVAGVTYFLDPKAQTVRKGTLALANTFTFRKGAMGGTVGVGPDGPHTSVNVRTVDGVTSVTVDGKPADPSTVAQLKMRGDFSPDPLSVEIAPNTRIGAAVMNDSSAAPDAFFFKRIERNTSPGESQSLGKQIFEGVESEGTRTTSTIPAGAIGNDRPIQSISERWYSPELQTVMMTKHSDPRTGEETFRLTDVNRGEPGADLFQVPPNYKTLDRM